MAYENLPNMVASKLGVSTDLKICSSTTLADEVKTGISCGNDLMSNWNSGHSNCGEIQKNLSSFKEFINSECNKRGIDRYFFLGLVAIESRGNPCCGGKIYKGLGQTANEPTGTSIEICKNQVIHSLDHILEKSRATKAPVSNALVVATAYNAGEALFNGNLGSSPTYKQVYDAVDSYRQKQGWGSGKIQEIRSYIVRLLGAWYVIRQSNYTGTSQYAWGTGGSGTISNYGGSNSGNNVRYLKTTRSWKTNPKTDWLLEPSDEERKYGINIYDGEQPLIKFSTYKAISEHGDYVGALKKYCEFLFYLLNSEVATAQITCIGMPWIRPGFNVWYDPINADAVYYCTNVQQQGTPTTGAMTSLTLVLGRDRKAYISDADRFGSFKDRSDNVFISDMKDEYRVAKFGECLTTLDGFENIKTASINYYNEEQFDTMDAKDSDFHKNIYVNGGDKSPAPENINKDKVFSGTYTEDEINKQLESMYSKAPDVVNSRRKQLKEAVSTAKKFFDKYRILETHTFG